MPASEGTRCAISGIDSLSEVICRFSCGRERHVRNLDRVANRLVLERQLRVDAVDAVGDINTGGPDWIVDDQRGVADADVVDGDRKLRTLPVGLLLLLLHQLRE